MRARAHEALRQVGAAHLAGRPLDQMSSGEARRVMLARVLAPAPRALVLDEPTAGLDLAARHAFMEHVRDIARAGTTIVLITHHVDEIVPEIDRVLFLKGGRLVADGAARGDAHLGAAQRPVRHAGRRRRGRRLRLRAAGAGSRSDVAAERSARADARRS